MAYPLPCVRKMYGLYESHCFGTGSEDSKVFNLLKESCSFSVHLQVEDFLVRLLRDLTPSENLGMNLWYQEYVCTCFTVFGSEMSWIVAVLTGVICRLSEVLKCNRYLTFENAKLHFSHLAVSLNRESL